jgi:hypothetical protein
MWYPGVEQASQVVFCQRDKAIEALPPQRAKEPFAEGVRLGALRRRFHNPQPQVPYAFVELPSENTVPVMEQKTIGVIRWERFAQLLKRPVGRRMGRHIDVEDAARGVLHYHEDVEEAERWR